MESPSNCGRVAHFGVFEADLQRQRLEKRGAFVQLQDKPFQVLALFLERAGEVVSRDELRRRLWSAETFVEFDEGVNAAVGKLRYALGDSAESPVFIETLRGKGYRWIAPVEWITDHDEAPSSARTNAKQPATLPLPTQPSHIFGVSARKALIVGTAVALLLMIVGALLWRGRQLAEPVRELKQQQITVNPTENPVLASSMSPDGKYLAYGDSDGLHLKLLESGEVRDIPQPESLRGTDMYWGLGSWSPDSTRVLAVANLAGSRYQAWTVSALGGTPTKVRDDAAPGIFTPDGSKIVFVTHLGPLGFREIWRAEANGGHAERLLEVDQNSQILGVQWSPEGKRFGYLRERQYGQKHEVTLETIDVRNGTARRLLSNEEMKEFLWLPQGRIIYTACRIDIHGFSCNYWEMRVNPDTGEPLGGQRPLTQWAGFYMANTGATADGKRLAFQRESKQLDVYVADFDARSLKLTRPRRLTHEEGLNSQPGGAEMGRR